MRMLRPLLIISTFIVLLSCRDNSTRNTEAIRIQKEQLTQSCEVFDQFITHYQYEESMHRDEERYGLKIYQYASQRYMDLLSAYKDRIRYHKGTDTTYLVHLYRTSIKEAIDLTDSLKKIKSLMLLPAEREAWFFTDHESLKLYPENGDYKLLQLVYLHDFETQVLRALNTVHPSYSCVNIIPAKFYDFMIIQNNFLNEKSYSVSVQNNFISRVSGEEHYSISFQDLAKINEKDTIPLNAAIAFSEKNKVYKTNAIPYEKGNYLLTLNLNYELPSGTIKVHEMKFEYELK